MSGVQDWDGDGDEEVSDADTGTIVGKKGAQSTIVPSHHHAAADGKFHPLATILLTRTRQRRRIEHDGCERRCVAVNNGVQPGIELHAEHHIQLIPRQQRRRSQYLYLSPTPLVMILQTA